MNKNISNIFNELKANHEDFRAEVLVAELAKSQGVKLDEILIAFEGTFDRAYRKDVSDVHLTENLNGIDMLHLELSRNGMYDTLPEGFFHNLIKDNTDYETARRELKKEEHAAKLLFSPVENEIFHHKVGIEKQRETITENFENLNDQFLIDLWKVNKNIPKKYSIRLVKLLPYAHKIAGNLEFTFTCLKRILNIDISYKKFFKTRQIAMGSEKEKRLGVNFVLHQEVQEIKQPFLEVTLNLQNTTVIENFFGENGVKKFVDIFYNYFIPIEYEISTKIDLVQEDNFLLGKKEACFLGMTTRL